MNHDTVKIKGLSIPGRIAPYLVLGLMLAASVWLWRYWSNAEKTMAQSHFDEYCEQISQDITDRLDDYKRLLRSGVGIFISSEEVTREEWRAYYEYRQVRNLFPGIQGISFVKVIEPSELAQHVESVRAEGFPEYSVWPDGERDVYTSVVFIEPFEERIGQALGYDAFSEPVRRAAMERARDTAMVAMSGRLRLVHEADEDPQAGFVIFVPVYAKGMPHTGVEERRAALTGYVSAVLRVKDLMRSIFAEIPEEVDFELYDGAADLPETLLFASRELGGGSGGEHRARFSSHTPLELYGHTWSLGFRSTPQFEAAQAPYLPWFILAVGLALSITVFLLIHPQQRIVVKAKLLAAKLSADLRASEETLRATLYSIGDAMISTDAEALVASMNPVAESLTGWSEQEAAGQPLETVFRIVNEHTRQPVESPARQVLKEGLIVGLANHTLLLAKDGREIPIADSGAPIRNATGKITGVVLVFRDQTEKHKAQLALEDGRQRLESMFRATRVGIGLASSGTITNANDPLCKIIGYSHDELIGQSPRMLFRSQKEFERSGFGKVGEAEKRGTDPLETVWLRKDGTQVDVLFSVSPIDQTDPGKGVTFTVGDITERKHAEEAMLQRLEYEHLVNEVSTMALVADDFEEFQDRCLTCIGESFGIDRTYIFRHDEATDSMDNTHEWCAEGIAPQRNKLQGIPGSDFPWWIQTMRRNEIICYSNIEEIPDEATRKVLSAQDIQSILVVPLFVKGQYFGFFGFDDCTQHRDWRQENINILLSLSRIVTMVIERRQAEEANSRLATAVEQAADVIIITDTDSRILYTNPAFVQVTGYSRDEALGQNPRFLKSGKHDAEFYRRMWAVLTAGQVWKGHMFNRRKDGTLYEEDSTISPVRDASGKITHYVAVKRDISHERLLEDQLNQAQKLESVGRLAGGVAHDFNNLLMGIMGYVDICRDGIEPDHPIREFLDEIILCSERSAEITRQLLAFARKQVITPKILDLNDTVAGMLKLLQRLIGEDIKLTWRPGANLRPVKLDPSQIDQILANLLVNARDAIAGVGEITLETGSTSVDAEFCDRYPEAIPSAYVFLAVSDDGCGMDKETLAQIFEPFFTTKGVGEGTGLGLATVYGIVKQNNGFIHAYSEPDKGTTFKIYLPQAAAMPEATSTADKKESPRGRGETILLVEDDDMLRMTCGTALKTLGYKFLVAETPEDALKMVDQHPGDIQVLLTDVVMPGMDGRQLAERISANNPGIKVLFMSGYTADVIALRGVLDEGVQFLQKPFTRDDLACKLRELLGVD
ncbi:MAG: PAS domain S-box protein [Kiritimatiellia bacterium]